MPRFSYDDVTFSQNVNSDDTIICRKKCTQNDVDCILNDTQTVTFQTLALPTIPYLPQPLILTTMRAIANSDVTFHTSYHILEGNENDLFDILKGQGVGSLRIRKSIQGPQELLLKILMTIHLNSNPRIRYTSTSKHLALIQIIVSQYDF